MNSSIQLVAPRGYVLSVTASGVGRAVMLLHGFPLDNRMWQNQVNMLAKRYRVLAPDLRGFGSSTLEGTQPSLAELADDIEFVRHNLVGDQPIVLVGLSMGGYVAFEYWRLYSEHLAGLVLANTKPEMDTDEARSGRLKMADEALRSGTWPAVAPMLGKLVAPSTAAHRHAVMEIVEQMMRSTSANTIAVAQHAMAQRFDFSNELARIHVPTLVVTGEHDPISPPKSNQVWSSLIERAQLRIIEDVGHLSPLESPLEFNTILSDFLDRLSVL